MLDAFARLGDHLAGVGVVADIHIVGGAVMVTEYEARDSTADVDAFDDTPHGAVERAAALVAAEMGLPPSWLNQQARAFVPRGADWRRSHSFDHPSLHLYVIVPEQLLALKVRAGRPTDADDIATLCRILRITTVAEVDKVSATPTRMNRRRHVASSWPPTFSGRRRRSAPAPAPGPRGDPEG